jgi:POT family proton-dependent oligopeptide transporter
MADSKYLTAPVPSKKTPAGIPYILTNEASERFAFYGMSMILTAYMINHLLDGDGNAAAMSEGKAKEVYHAFKAVVYAIPIVGALLADLWLGKFKTIIIFSIVYCFGFLSLILDQTRVGLYTGLALIALGSGMIKPCVSANVGDQFGKTNQHLMAKFFSWFYFSINFGAFIAPLITAKLLVEKKCGPAVAFGVTGFFMILATLSYWMGRRKLVHVPPGGVAFLKETFSAEGVKAVCKLLIIFLFVAMFFALFDQTGSAWIIQAGKMDMHLLGFEWDISHLNLQEPWAARIDAVVNFQWEPSQLTALNALFIMMLIPVYSYVIYPAINKVFPLTPLRKISIGMFLTVLAFAIPAWIQMRIDNGETPGSPWQVLAYLVISAAEVMVSITCLEFSYTQAPRKMKSFLSGVYLLASISLGNVFTSVVNKVIQNEDGSSKLEGASYYWFFTIVMLVASFIFIFVAKAYREKTYILDDQGSDEATGEQ